MPLGPLPTGFEVMPPHLDFRGANVQQLTATRLTTLTSISFPVLAHGEGTLLLKPFDKLSHFAHVSTQAQKKNMTSNV